MAAFYKTPGVYVEEIPKFPPSIAAVETAIPAFIGYTQKADELAVGDLHNVPKRIGSIADYELYYGFDHVPAITGIVLDDQGFFKTATFDQRFLLYNSLRMFYANGGGDCYIVSVGGYGTPTKDDFLNAAAGIQALEKYDEPTILLFPDASQLEGNVLYEIQAAALAQCELLKDRVGLFDLKETDPKGDDFRSKSGINSLKYGMAYTPWLATSFLKGYSYSHLRKPDLIKNDKADTVTLESLTANKALLATLDNLKKTMADVDTVGNSTPKFLELRDAYLTQRAAYTGDKSVGKLADVATFLYDIAHKVDVLVGVSPLTSPDLVNAVQLVIGSLQPTYKQLLANGKEAESKITDYHDPTLATPPTADKWAGIFTSSPPPASNNLIPAFPTPVTSEQHAQQMNALLSAFDAAFLQINNLVVSGIVQAVSQHEKTLNDALYASFPQYKAIVNGVEAAANTLPPSGTVAGIFALVDRTRGVWKAPANVSVTGGEPTVKFTLSELERLNVDTTAGKSINVIRAFTGKGTLVYGARTLAGNDNEWRYVSVRRLFNFVEESIKKATEQFVFEPNDANTWVRVQAMIENFLTILWRQGALQGIKPEHAFYAAVGLGKTMTALDILEGRMVIEIGMAAVRPAEFIILKFSHKMAES